MTLDHVSITVSGGPAAERFYDAILRDLLGNRVGAIRHLAP